MGGKLGNLSALGNPLHHFRPGPDTDRGGQIAIRHRQEERTTVSAQASALLKVGYVERASCLRVGHHALHHVFGRFCSHTNQAVSWVNIMSRKRTQFFSSQPCIVSQGEHEPVAKWFCFCCFKDRAPLPLIWQPGEFLVAGNESSITLPRKSLARSVSASANGIPLADAFFNEVVIPQANSGQVLLQRGICQANS